MRPKISQHVDTSFDKQANTRQKWRRPNSKAPWCCCFRIRGIFLSNIRCCFEPADPIQMEMFERSPLFACLTPLSCRASYVQLAKLTSFKFSDTSLLSSSHILWWFPPDGTPEPCSNNIFQVFYQC